MLQIICSINEVKNKIAGLSCTVGSVRCGMCDGTQTISPAVSGVVVPSIQIASSPDNTIKSSGASCV